MKGRDNSEVRSLIRRFGGSGGGGGLADGSYGDIDVTSGGTVLSIVATLDEIPSPAADVDFAQQEALQFVIENRTSDPGSPVSGQIWLRTDL